MPESPLLSLILIFIFILLSAFFSSSEAAFLSLERVRITHLVNSDVPGAKMVARMIEQPERLLSTILLGNNLVNVAFTAVITLLTVELLGEGRGLAVATGVGTAVLLLFGEIIPKTIAVRNAEKVSIWYARPLRAVELLLFPVVMSLQWLTFRISALVGAGNRTRESVTEGELRTLIDIGEAEGTFEASEAQLLENVFRFGDRQVREVMTPRPEIIAIERGASLSEFLTIYSENSHTRFPIYVNSEDNIIGIISAKDVLRAMAGRGITYDGSVTDAIRDTLFIPETKRIAELFDEMRQSGNQMAMVIDEYGGLSGLVTLKRLVEEVVGAVGEEGEGPEEEYETIDENTFQVEGGMSIDEANEELSIDLPEGDFDTVAGFILEVLGHIPTQGEQFEYRNLKIEIIEMVDLKIETIKVTKLPPSESDLPEETSREPSKQ